MPQVTTSLTISFQSQSSSGGGAFSAEVDSRPDGLNKGRTQFVPGDSVAILLYASASISSIAAFKTDGSLAEGSPVVVTQKEIITLANSREFSTRYPVMGSASYQWYGASPGAVTRLSDTQFSVPKEVIAVGEITYTTTARVYTLSNVTQPAALVVFTGVAP